MSLQNCRITLRLDESAEAVLKKLASELNFNRSRVVRRALRLMKALSEIEKRNGQILIRDGKQEKVFVLLD
jgi:predicted transcriptional regulator